MALAFAVEFDPEDMGAPRFTHGLAPRPRRRGPEHPWRRAAAFARGWLKRAAAARTRAMLEVAPETLRREQAAIAAAFDRAAELIGLTRVERLVLSGVGRDPSRVILALETLGAALDLFGAPEAARDWLRAERPQAPFNGRAPLALFAAEGTFGVELGLLHLRARLRELRR
jgi:hypothetical protein